MTRYDPLCPVATGRDPLQSTATAARIDRSAMTGYFLAARRNPARRHQKQPFCAAHLTHPDNRYGEPMSKFSTEGFIQDKIEVEDPNAVRVFGKSAPVAPFSPQEGRIIFIGLPGSGRLELAERVAARLNMKVVAPETDTPSGSGQPIDSVEALDAACADKGIVFVLPHTALRSEAIRTALREKGKVFYLMAEVLRMAYRLNKMTEPEREAISAEFVELEPLCMMTLHYILQAWKEPEEIVDNVLEMLGIQG